MSITPQNARKEIFARVDQCWAARAPAVLAPAPPPEMRYQGVERETLPGSTKHWARASTQLATTKQSAHVTDVDGASPVEFATVGIAFIQIFAPMSEAGGYAKGELLAGIAQRIFMAGETPSGVWFRNPRINELPNDGTWYRWNVIADFQFNQTKGT